MTLLEFLKGNVKYDKFCQELYLVQENGDLQRIADLRAWEAIRYLFKRDNGSYDTEMSANFHDELGKFIADAVNEKLERERIEK